MSAGDSDDKHGHHHDDDDKKGPSHDHDHHKDTDHGRDDHEKDDDDDHDGGHGKGGTKGGEGGTYKGPTATPYLIIPTDQNDTGARPIPAAAGLYNQSVIANIVKGATWADFELQLSCVVANLGVVGCAVGVAEFYVGDLFSVWSASHETATVAQVRTNAQRIGYTSFNVPPGGTVTINCNKLWKPGSSVNAQKGVLVQVYEVLTDHMTSPFDALNDRHVARNDEVMDPIIF